MTNTAANWALHPGATRNGIAYLSYRKQSILYLIQFDVDPEGLYLDHPWEKSFDYGDAIQMYNDDGRFGRRLSAMVRREFLSRMRSWGIQ